MIQAEIGGAARITPGNGVQRPGFILRDFTLASSRGENLGISSFHGRSNLVVVFPAFSSAMWEFVAEVTRNSRQFSEQDTTVFVIVPQGSEEQVPEDRRPGGQAEAAADHRSIIFLYDQTQHAYRLSGATDENSRPIPLIYLTDRFGEIVSTYAAPAQPMPPSIGEVLSALEFINWQCPECEPPEWPR